MEIKDWIFLAMTGLCTVPLQAALIYTLYRTFREPVARRPPAAGDLYSPGR